MKRYERYAAEIAEMIDKGVLRPGERLPSVRHASTQRRISPATVFEAYYLLEARGLIHARARSGYYVSERLQSRAPQTSRPKQRSAAVAISDLVFDVLGSTRDRNVVPIGSAFPSAALSPLQTLARHLSHGMRALDPKRIVDDLPPGNERLRRQIARRYAIDEMRIDPAEIIVTNGALEALNLCLSAATRPGDTVAVESPTFYAALQALERLSLKAVEIATHPRDGIDLDALETALRRANVKACWLMPNFQNPLGSLMPDDKKQSLVALLAKHEVPLIEDDVYAELYFGPRRPLPAKAFDRKGLVMHCSSFSKCLAPGYRVGWAAAGQFSKQVERMKLMTTLSAAIPSQQALSGYLDQGGYDRHLRKLRRVLAAQRDVAMKQVAEYFPEGTRVTRPEGGYFLWVELPRHIDALELQRQAASRQISIAPGHLFSADGAYTNCIRLNYGHPDDQRIGGALRTIGKLAGDLGSGVSPKGARSA
ncbi:DNA-binding transcriptional MocR family regulator [Povalibacter uvarum]|uniref:DNA-binding transcriptional MocR family regulator n=1 Tax=Povalibacter uvarum TaxID=732238 RepID=A0A841HPC1_9GAMM|nr:PLP-dependent aminotransferase family protein [Povalibacter uvarum]MBB6094623.1 DNA-binding transcriptional MocR family regulator [Povalibacter uvarum]